MSSWYSLVPRPPPSFPSLAVRKSGRGPGTFPHVSDVMDRANYTNIPGPLLIYCTISDGKLGGGPGNEANLGILLCMFFKFY